MEMKLQKWKWNRTRKKGESYLDPGGKNIRWGSYHRME